MRKGLERRTTYGGKPDPPSGGIRPNPYTIKMAALCQRLYCSSETFSSQSTATPFRLSWIAMWVIAVV